MVFLDNRSHRQFDQPRLSLLPGGAAPPPETLHVWRYDGSKWADFTALDLTDDGNYASFTVTGLSGYAMVAVPEPGTMAASTTVCSAC